MSIHIGLMIWKEMKRRDLSSATLAESLEISKNKMQTILNNTSIDTDLLLKICEVLNFDFFKYYEENKIFTQLKVQSKQKTVQEIERLKGLVVEKNRTIDLKDQLIKTQNNTIALLEKGQYN